MKEKAKMLQGMWLPLSTLFNKHLLWRGGLIASPELRVPMTGVTTALADRLGSMGRTCARCGAPPRLSKYGSGRRLA